MQWVRANNPHYDITVNNNAVGGHFDWSNLVRIDDLIATAPDIVTFDSRPYDDNQQAAIEAIIRRIWTALPDCHLRFVSHSSVTDRTVDASINTPLDETYLNYVKTLCTYYGGIPVYDDIPVLQDLINNQGQHLMTYYADNTHPNAAGYALIDGLLEVNYLGSSGAKPVVLPASFGAFTDDYLHGSTIKNGTDYDSRSGTWADIGTVTSSTEVGAIITYSATCTSFGVNRLDGNPGGNNNQCQVSIDGGAYASIVADQNGYKIPSGYGVHTIAIKCTTGAKVQIDEFWAV